MHLFLPPRLNFTSSLLKRKIMYKRKNLIRQTLTLNEIIPNKGVIYMQALPHVITKLQGVVIPHCRCRFNKSSAYVALCRIKFRTKIQNN